MIEELLGKRLLVLGGNSWADAIKQFTEENGIVMIAAEFAKYFVNFALT